MGTATAEIGLVGLAVMGQNLALNVAEKVRRLPILHLILLQFEVYGPLANVMGRWFFRDSQSVSSIEAMRRQS